MFAIAGPLFWLGLPLLIGAVFFTVAFMIEKNDCSIMSDKWMVCHGYLKVSVAAAIIAMLMIIGAYLVQGVNAPREVRVEVEKIVEVPQPTQYSTYYRTCLADFDIDQVRRHNRPEYTSRCHTLANDQMLTEIKGPIRTQTITKFKQLPFDEFMTSCMPMTNAEGVEGIVAAQKIHSECLDAATVQMKGLVANGG